MVCFAIGMALHNDGSYEDILALITDGLAWSQREGVPDRLASKAAVSHARARLGSAPVKELFTRTAHPLATDTAPGCFLSGRRPVAVDGTCLAVPDTPANDAHFGRPGTAKGVKPRVFWRLSVRLVVRLLIPAGSCSERFRSRSESDSQASNATVRC
jgi:hypothetical protein